MTYEQANEWFKRWHADNHQVLGVPMSAANCLRNNCGQMWRHIIRVYPTTAPQR
jgi:hypothetical protein